MDENKISLSQAQFIVHAVYESFLGRSPDAAGMLYWSEQIMQTGDAGLVLNAISQSGEYKQRQASLARCNQQKAALRDALMSQLHAAPLQIVDVGAQELADEEHVYAPLTTLPHHIIGFEPLQEKIDESLAKHPERPVTLLPTFIGDGQSHTFHINNFDATSSLLPLNQNLNQYLVDLSHLKTVHSAVVSTSTLDIALHDIARFDFLKLDIQGFELPALQHASSVLARTNVVHCEVSFAEIYAGQALFSEVESLLRAQGFDFIDFSSKCHYPYHTASKNLSRDRLGWGDAVFFKRSEHLSARDLLAQSAIALLVYNKPSLAEFLVQKADALANSTVASIFAQ